MIRRSPTAAIQLTTTNPYHFTRLTPSQDVFTQSTGHTKTLGNFVKASTLSSLHTESTFYFLSFTLLLTILFPGDLQRSEEHVLVPHP